MKLSKAHQLALQHLAQIEAGLLAGTWVTVRSAALQLAALADNRATRETK
jgi:hypothetical protein